MAYGLDTLSNLGSYAWDGLSSTGKWLTDGDHLKGLGAVGSAGGNIYGGIVSSDLAKQNLDFQKSSYNQQYNDYQRDKKKNSETYSKVFGGNTGTLGSYGSAV